MPRERRSGGTGARWRRGRGGGATSRMEARGVPRGVTRNGTCEADGDATDAQGAATATISRPRGAADRPPVNPLLRLARWVAAQVRGFWAGVGIFLAIGFAVSLAALAGFLWLARSVGAGGRMERVDVAVLTWLREREGPLLDLLGLLGTALGSGVAAYFVLAGSAILFWRSRHRLSALLLLATLVGARLLIGVLKQVYERPRPALFGDQVRALGMTFDYPGSASFPSGHAVIAVAVFGTLAYLVARLRPKRRQRVAVLGGALLLILLIGFSRLYFAVHYPSDVVAGFLAGLVWATFCASALEVGAYVARRRPGAVPEEVGVERGMTPPGGASHG